MTDMKKPAVGDVVTLKSGSPKMTVNSVGEQIGLIWFNEQGVVCTARLNADCVTVLDGGVDGKH